MSDAERRDALLRSFAWRFQMFSGVEVDMLDELASKIEHERDLAQRYTFFDPPSKPGPAATAKIEAEYRRLKSITIPPITDARDVVGDGPTSSDTHAPDIGGES